MSGLTKEYWQNRKLVELQQRKAQAIEQVRDVFADQDNPELFGLYHRRLNRKMQITWKGVVRGVTQSGVIVTCRQDEIVPVCLAMVDELQRLRREKRARKAVAA